MGVKADMTLAYSEKFLDVMAVIIIHRFHAYTFKHTNNISSQIQCLTGVVQKGSSTDFCKTVNCGMWQYITPSLHFCIAFVEST